MNTRTVGLEIVSGHLQLNDAETVMDGLFPSQVMNDGAVVPLSVDVKDTHHIHSQPHRFFAIVTLTSPMVCTDHDIYKWLDDPIGRPNMAVHSDPESVKQALEQAENREEMDEVLDL